MSDLTEKKDYVDDLLPVQMIATVKGVSQRWVRQQIADFALEPVELRETDAHGSKQAYYSLKELEAAVSGKKDMDAVSQMSDAGKTKFLIGHIELEGTPEQQQAIRLYVDQVRAEDRALIEAQTKQLVTMEKDLVRVQAENDRVWKERAREQDMHGRNLKAYNMLLDRCPDSMLTEKEIEWKGRPSGSDWARFFTGRDHW
jgi:hypothetical protein